MVLFLHRLGWFVFLVLLQVLVLNHVHILGYATPMLYIYYILILNAETPRKSLLLQAFFIGLCIDIFSNTPGMNAAAATMMAFTRRPLLRMQMLRDVTDDYVPGIRSMGFYPFFRYVLSETVVFIVTLQVIDAFTFFRMSELMWKILTDTLMPIVGIICIDTIRRKK